MKVEKILNEKEQTSQIQGLSKMKVVRTAVYARVSTDMDIQKSSLEEQMKSFRAKIDEHPGWVLVDIYADEGISGTRVKHRKAFLRMIKDCEEGKVDYILAKSISRFARNTVECLYYVRYLQSLGVQLFFEKEYIETALYLISTPNTGLFFVYCSICCGFSGYSETVYCVLSLICRLNLQTDTER